MTTRRTPARPPVRPFIRLGAATAAAGLVVLGIAAPASAHVSVTPSTTAAGGYALLTFSVPHGCDGSATTKVEISIPEGINAVTPTRNSFYEVDKTTEQLDPAVTDAHGNEITERVSVVTYTATTPLTDGYRDALDLSLQLPDAEGETLSFPVIQTCEKGRTDWTEVPADGQSEDDLEYPAPAFTVTAAGEGDHHDEAEEEPAESDEVGLTTESADPATETASASTDSDDGGNGLAIAGLVAGVLGLVAGGAALARSGRKA